MNFRVICLGIASIVMATMALATSAEARFLQTDPVGYKDQMNMYAYVSNDPFNRKDPTGRVDIKVNQDGSKTVSFSRSDTAAQLIGMLKDSGAVAAKESMPGAGIRDGLASIEEGGVANIATGIVMIASELPSLKSLKMLKSIKRFERKAPANAKDSVQTHDLPDGGTAVTANSPGKVPGSSAQFEKQIDKNGDTMSFTKTTFDPDGNVVHVKDKITGEVIEP